MDDFKKAMLMVDFSGQDPSIPERGPDACPKCKCELEAGFGLAGGGYGVYMFCPKCGEILSKTQTE